MAPPGGRSMLQGASPDCGTPDPARRRLLTLAAAGVAIAISGCATPTGTGDAIDARPPPAAGSVFVFDVRNGYTAALQARAELSFTATGARLDGYAYAEAGNAGFGRALAPIVAREFDAEGRLLAWVRGDGLRTTFEPALRVLPPLAAGSQRQDAIARDSDGSRPRQVTLMLRVGRWETVRVPAGEFRTLRIERDLFMGDSDFFRTQTERQEIDWYAPELGIAVRSSEDSRHLDLAMGGGGWRGARGAQLRRGDWLVRELAERPAAPPGR